MWWLLLAAMTAVLLAGGWQAAKHPSPAVQTELLTAASANSSLNAKITGFSLIDQSGKPFESRELLGKVWIADFIFTSCAGTCPEMSRQMRNLQEKLPAEVQLVSFTVDPKRDTPAVLSRYAKQVGADLERWRFLTGEEEAIRRLAKEQFRLGVAEGADPEEPIIHSVRFILIDPAGQIRGFYDATDPKKLEELVRDARTVHAARTGRAGERIVAQTQRSP